jgi:Flp pilus assembly protein TadG
MRAFFQEYNNRRGAAAVIVAILIVVLVGFAALALDIGHLAVVRGELQNAADAGALAGARILLTPDGSGNEIVNPDAGVEARRAATENASDNAPVEVDLASDVQTGSWDGSSFTASTPGNKDDSTYINAVKVTAHRSAAYSIFATIFGISSFASRASAVAYRGWAGENVKYDQPIALCRDMLVDPVTGKFACTTGRMFSNGGGSSTVGTALWTNFSNQCVDTANTPSITNAVNLGCGGNLEPVSLSAVSTNNGAITPALTAAYNCWAPNAPNMPTKSWEITLPVVECVSPPTCSTIVAAVKVQVVWITSNGNDPQYNNIPAQMDDWSQSEDCSDLALGTRDGRQQCWNRFVDHFNLKYMNTDGTQSPATYQPATIYFKPVCDYESLGGPGGEEFNVHAQYPKLVQ